MSLPNEFYDLQARAASAQLRAEQSENREQVLQLEFIDMRNRAELAEKSALDLKVIVDHLQRQRAADNDAHGKDIADLQKQNGQLYKDLNDKHESWRNTQVRLEKAIKERDEYAKVAADLQKALATSEERRERLVKAFGNLEPNPEGTQWKQIADLQIKLKQANGERAELTRQRDAYKVEYESRAIWIEKMNAILGYDNSDGFHGSPCPHEIAQRMKDDLTHAFNLPGAGKTPPVNDPNAPSRAELEKQLADLANSLQRARDLAAERCAEIGRITKELHNAEKERDEANERWMLQSNASKNHEADRLRQVLEAARNILDLAE